MLQTPVEPSDATIRTSSDPAGGVTLTVQVIDVRTVTDAGPDASSVIVPPGEAGRISASAQDPMSPVGADAPTVTAPGVPVAAVVRSVP